MGPAAVELGHEGRRLVGVGQDEDLADRPGQCDMEDAPFPLLVVAQTVGEESPGGAIHNDVLPLPALDLVDRREEHGRPFGRWPLEHAAEPRLERGHVRVEGGHRFEGEEVVGMGRSVRL
ncbi:MAG: hypothetical protein ABSB68_17615, partial [Acidimicrobiales bacterium]